MKIIKANPDKINEDIIFEAINVLANGGIVLYPTDTVYGLGANIFNNRAVRRVFEIKKRSFLKPLFLCFHTVYLISAYHNTIVIWTRRELLKKNIYFYVILVLIN